MDSTWIVVGAGRCGLQLARSMHAAGLTVPAVVSRSAAARRSVRRSLLGVPTAAPGTALPPCEAVMIAVADQSIHDAALALTHSLHPSVRHVFHTSGARPRLLADACRPLAALDSGRIPSAGAAASARDSSLTADGLCASVRLDDAS